MSSILEGFETPLIITTRETSFTTFASGVKTTLASNVEVPADVNPVAEEITLLVIDAQRPKLNVDPSLAYVGHMPLTVVPLCFALTRFQLWVTDAPVGTCILSDLPVGHCATTSPQNPPSHCEETELLMFPEAVGGIAVGVEGRVVETSGGGAVVTATQVSVLFLEKGSVKPFKQLSHPPPGTEQLLRFKAAQLLEEHEIEQNVLAPPLEANPDLHVPHTFACWQVFLFKAAQLVLHAVGGAISQRVPVNPLVQIHLPRELQVPNAPQLTVAQTFTGGDVGGGDWHEAPV